LGGARVDVWAELNRVSSNAREQAVYLVHRFPLPGIDEVLKRLLPLDGKESSEKIQLVPRLQGFVPLARFGISFLLLT
jgi:hypothetical protein